MISTDPEKGRQILAIISDLVNDFFTMGATSSKQ